MTPGRVEQDCYHGPLDLLVCLVKMNEVDILDIALARIAEAYFEAIGELTAEIIEQAGEFLVLLTTLMEAKSRALIPTTVDVKQQQEQDDRRELVKQLLDYKRFKEAAALLWEKARRHQQRMARAVDDLPSSTADPATQPIRELELWDLVSAFSRMMKENIVAVTDRIPRDPTPISAYMDVIQKTVIERGEATFRELIGDRNTKPQLIGKFLALLELIKQRRVWVEPGTDPESIRVFPPRTPPPIDAEESMAMEDENAPPDAMLRQEQKSPAPPDRQSDSEPSGDDDDWSRENAPDAPDGDTTGRTSAWDDFEPLID